MSALDDPRVARLYDFAKAVLRSGVNTEWQTMVLILAHPSAKVMHRHILSQGGDHMPDGTAMMVGDASRLRAAGIPVDKAPYVVIGAGDINAVLEIVLEEPTDEEAAKLGAEILGGRR